MIATELNKSVMFLAQINMTASGSRKGKTPTFKIREDERFKYKGAP